MVGARSSKREYHRAGGGQASATDLNAARGMGIPLVASSGTTRYLRVLLAGVVIIPLVLITAVSWLNYNAAFQDAHDRVSRAADAIREYAQSRIH